MKRVVVTVAVVLALGIAACTPTTSGTTTPTPDIPKYTADQVVMVAQARYPTCFRTEIVERRNVHTYTTSIVSVSYIGGSRRAWKVEVSCPHLHRLVDALTTKEVLYFYETDGSLSDKYYP